MSAGKPVITSMSTNADGSYHLTGTGFNGISEGASYGDDAQMDSNYPLVRFEDAGAEEKTCDQATGEEGERLNGEKTVIRLKTLRSDESQSADQQSGTADGHKPAPSSAKKARRKKPCG